MRPTGGKGLDEDVCPMAGEVTANQDAPYLAAPKQLDKYGERLSVVPALLHMLRSTKRIV